jgi:YggT family protein
MNINPFINLLTAILELYSWTVLIWIIMTWLVHFKIINAYQPFVFRVMILLSRLVDPVLHKIRRVVPSIAGIDISPIILFLLINFTQDILHTYFYTKSLMPVGVESVIPIQ